VKWKRVVHRRRRGGASVNRYAIDGQARREPLVSDWDRLGAHAHACRCMIGFARRKRRRSIRRSARKASGCERPFLRSISTIKGRAAPGVAALATTDQGRRCPWAIISRSGRPALADRRRAADFAGRVEAVGRSSPLGTPGRPAAVRGQPGPPRRMPLKYARAGARLTGAGDYPADGKLYHRAMVTPNSAEEMPLART
jgi:hypothetical protein